MISAQYSIKGILICKRSNVKQIINLVFLEMSNPPHSASSTSPSVSSGPYTVPREAKLVSLLLSSCGVGDCEPKVVQQLMEFMHRYVTDVLQEASLYSEHAGKAELDYEDLRLSIRNQQRNMFIQPPSRDVCLLIDNIHVFLYDLLILHA